MKNLVCIFAHPDDEFIAAGLLFRAKKHGYKTHLICATNGEAGRIKGQKFLGDPNELLVDIRLKEFNKSCEILSVDSLHLLNLPDNNAIIWNVESVTNRLKSILLDIGPSVMVTFNKDGGNNHPDHKGIHNISVRAFEEIGSKDFRLFFITKHPKNYISRKNLVKLPPKLLDKVTINDDEVSMIIQLTDDEVATKKKIIENYRSQFPDENGLYYKMPYSILINLSQFETFEEFNKKENQNVEMVDML